MPRPHPPEFRLRAVEFAWSKETPVAEIAADLGISESCLRNWVRQTDIDEGRRTDRSIGTTFETWVPPLRCRLMNAITSLLVTRAGVLSTSVKSTFRSNAIDTRRLHSSLDYRSPIDFEADQTHQANQAA